MAARNAGSLTARSRSSMSGGSTARGRGGGAAALGSARAAKGRT
jgi:hypothetical protein